MRSTWPQPPHAGPLTPASSPGPLSRERCHTPGGATWVAYGSRLGRTVRIPPPPGGWQDDGAEHPAADRTKNHGRPLPRNLLPLAGHAPRTMISARMTERAEELPEVANLPHMGFYGRVENLIVRDFQPSCPQFGCIQVLELFAVLASGAGLSRLKRLPARLEFVPGPAPHLTEVADAEGQCPELIEHSAHGFRAGAGARLAPSLVADGVLLVGDRAGGVAVARA